MPGSILEFALLSLGICLVQGLLVIPWLAAVDPGLLFTPENRWRGPLRFAGILLAAWLGLTWFLASNNDTDFQAAVGRVCAFLFQAQLGADVLVLILFGMLKLWPKGGAVALSAFREGTRQPMFWLLLGVGFFLILISPILPYFTFGEDLKMLKDLGYMTIMFTGAVFGILAASMSISEEIEGRAAITVMSKPISRRNYLIGKFIGIVLAAGLMNLILSWLLVWVIIFYEWWNPAIRGVVMPDPAWIVTTLNQLFPDPGPAAFTVRGMLLWFDVSGAAFPGFVITGCQVMVLIAISVALATRVPMIVNALLCLAVYFLGHLTPVLTAISERRYPLVRFLAQVFNYVLPGLDMFDMGPAVVRYSPLPTYDFGVYTLYVTVYALMYTAIALLFGLILFEDRDLA